MTRILIGVIAAAAAVAAYAADPMSGSFKDLDTNTDGKLSSAEVSSQSTLSADFSAIDADKDGYVSQSEYDAWKASSSTMPGQSDKPTTSDPQSAPTEPQSTEPQTEPATTPNQ